MRIACWDARSASLTGSVGVDLLETCASGPASKRARSRAPAVSAASLATARQVAISLPATITIRFKSSDYAELASRVAGCERTGALDARVIGDDPLELYRTFITIVLLCRGLQE